MLRLAPVHAKATRARMGLCFVASGLLLALAGRVGPGLDFGPSATLSWPRKGVLGVGVALVLLGAISLTVRHGATAMRPRARGLVLGVTAVAAAVLLWGLLGGLDQSLWHDEAFTVLTYIDGGPRAILTGSYVPNDHVLFNLLSWGTVGILGESEVGYRLWSVIPALAAAALTVAWTWSRLDAWTAATVAVLIATSPVILELSRDARGYGLTFLAGALLLIFSDRLARAGSPRDLGGFSVGGLLGVLTLPIFSVAFVGQALPLMATREIRRRVLLAMGIVGLLALLIYAPTLRDVLDAADQQFGKRLAWHGPLSTVAVDLLGPNVQFVFGSELRSALSHDVVLANSAIAAAIGVAGALLLWRNEERHLMALLLIPPLFVYGVLTAGRFFVDTRFASFLIFHVLVLAAAGIVGLVRILPTRWARAVATAGATVAGLAALSHALQAGDALHDLPKENFKEAAAVVRSKGGGRILTDSTRPQGLQHYLGVKNVIALPPGDLEKRFCSRRERVVFVEHPFRAPNEGPLPNVSCLAHRGARVVRVLQRERGGHLDVWYSPAQR